MATMADNSNYRPQRPRTSSMLSWGSHKSKESQPKVDLVETERDKAQRRIKGKADPSVAINELQPADRNLEKTTMMPLRSMQFRDQKGEIITDPDRSNPTRPRMERPLDTIRSFEAAIDSSYGRRYSSHPDYQSRRSSFYQNPASPQPRNPANQFNGANFDRQPDSRPESVYDQYQGNGNAHGNNQSRRVPNGRTNGEPVQTGLPQARHNYQQSYDTTTASSAGTYRTEQGTASTEPSSYNGSSGELHQMGQHAKPQPPLPRESYGVDFGSNQEDMYRQSVDEYGQPTPPFVPVHEGYAPNGMPTSARGYKNPPYANPQEVGLPPPPPPHANSARGTLRKPMAPNGSNAYPNGAFNQQSMAAERPKNEKRKSWLARRFSKQS